MPSRLCSMRGPGTLVLSILAGKTIGNLRARLPQAGAMAGDAEPAGLGATGNHGGRGRRAGDRATQGARSASPGRVGRAEWLDDEGLIDAVTAVSGLVCG
jgi:pyrroline-5-carboxylate reductase